MKKLTFLIAGLFALCATYAQTSKESTTVEVIYPTEFHITKPLRELMAQNPGRTLSAEEKEESRDREFRRPYMPKINNLALPLGEDPARQKHFGTREALAPLVIWDGMTGDASPPDPTGAAGPNHYVQAVNTSYRIYSKTGVPAGPKISLGTLLFGSTDGDPIVMYDKYADRFIITEFKGFGSNNKILLGVSMTSDPTGQYYTWQFTSPQFPDYEKFSIWSNGYYMTSNQSNQKVFVFERDSMIAGRPGSRALNATFSPPNGSGFFCPLPADADGQLPPVGTPCPIFSYEDDGWGTGYADRINIFNMNVTWGATPTANITMTAQLPTQPFDASYNSSWNDIPQPGTSQKLDGIGGVFTYRAQYRRWTGYNTVVLNGGVKVNSTTRSIRWYELRQDAVSGTWSIYQQSTYAPDAINRWVGSIAMDDNGSIGLAYCVSASSGTYPGIRYTGRAAGDSLNTMTLAEQTVAVGNSSQSGFNRWGDYSHMTLDPVDGTIFWHTGEYYLNNNSATKIFSFQIPNTPVGTGDISKELSFKVFHGNDMINIRANNLPSNKELVVDLFDISGRLISGKTITPVGYAVETGFSSSSLARGTYMVRIGNMNTSFQKVAKVVVE